MKALLVDPSLFTAPYDAELTRGLADAGVETLWTARAQRPNEAADLSPTVVKLQCYRWTDGPKRSPSPFNKSLKGVEHMLDMLRLIRLAHSAKVDVVHFQWAEIPIIDKQVFSRLSRNRPVVFTVHDTTPLNGADVSPLQRVGFSSLFARADALIVHTDHASEVLQRQGVNPSKVHVIPHGPLPLARLPRPAVDKAPTRWRVVLFGRIQSYKGVDVLVEALGLLSDTDRQRFEVIVAGDPLISLAPIKTRAEALGLKPPLFQLRPGRLDDQSMADLLGSADCFVFPYRAIESSGVLYLVAGLRRYIVASALGSFVDAIAADRSGGALVPPDDPKALALALVESIGRVPASSNVDWAPDWETIGRRTEKVYRAVLEMRQDRTPSL